MYYYKKKMLWLIAEWTICKCEGQGKAYGSGDGTAQDCVFPFKHNGKTYNSCATAIDGNGAYCATKVDSNGNLVKDNWSRCNEYCDNDKGKMNILGTHLFFLVYLLYDTLPELFLLYL